MAARSKPPGPPRRNTAIPLVTVSSEDMMLQILEREAGKRMLDLEIREIELRFNSSMQTTELKKVLQKFQKVGKAHQVPITLAKGGKPELVEVEPLVNGAFKVTRKGPPPIPKKK